MATNVPVTMDTLIAVKVLFLGQTRRFKIPLQDLGARELPSKIRSLLPPQVLPDTELQIERWSDSQAAYVTLRSDQPQVYKTLFRAAKAKLKLRLRVTVVGPPQRPTLTPPALLTRESSEAELNTAQPLPMHSQDPYTAPSVHREASRSTQATTTTTTPASPVIARTLVPPPTWNRPEVEPAQPSPDVNPVTPLKPSPESHISAAARPRDADLAFRPKDNTQSSWVVFCNNCSQAMESEHFHCSICDNGDYDLCPTCLTAGVHCPGTSHWMVKRFVVNGRVVNSTTERVLSKPVPEAEQGMPGAFMDEKQPVAVDPEVQEPDRTCNCCVKVLPEKEFVTCTTCDDYDLCMDCHMLNNHGHHPAHGFKAAAKDSVLPALAEFLCNAGRNVRHSAVCDGCEKFIFGVRHKCLHCPDWDYCSQCIKGANFSHPRHRFVPIFEPLAEPATLGGRHTGVYCDGPLCKDKDCASYIEGIRYKCAVCNDTDFCGNCEALPTNNHNRTHPLIKFNIPVRNVSITTLSECKTGSALTRHGDEASIKFTAKETGPVAAFTSNAATQVETTVDVKSTSESQPKTNSQMIKIRDLLAEPVQEKIAVDPHRVTQSNLFAYTRGIAAKRALSKSPEDLLDAQYIRDTLVDGTVIEAGQSFVQVWTLRNPGPIAWPAGCSVRNIGGDNMLNIDHTRSVRQDQIAVASESNVVGRAVEPGEEIAFRMVMKAPIREGTAISYWRLMTADGIAFGNRLWCDIKVSSPTSPPAAPETEIQEAELPDNQSPEPSVLPSLNTMVAAAGPSGKAPEHDPLMGIGSGLSGTGSSSGYSCNMPRLQRWQRMRLERLGEIQRAQQQAMSQFRHGQLERPGEEATDAMNRQQEETLDKLRKLKLTIEEKDPSTRIMNKIEQEKFARTQKVRKAAVERLLEERRKKNAAVGPETAVNPFQAPMSVAEQDTAELPAEEKPVEEKPAKDKAPDSYPTYFKRPDYKFITAQMPDYKFITAQMPPAQASPSHATEKPVWAQVEETSAEEAPAESSGMIFPQLDKESPASSTHEAASIKSETKPAEPVVAEGSDEYEDVSVSGPSQQSDDEFFEDAESLGIRSIDDNESFLTDDEYDILDASDEEAA